MGDVEVALAVGLPALLVFVAVTSWWVVGRSLRPIDQIRAEVATITGSDLHRRLPVPRSGDEVARLAQTMNGMLDRLETAAERQRAFVADASHELRSPLNALRTQLEVGLVGGNERIVVGRHGGMVHFAGPARGARVVVRLPVVAGGPDGPAGPAKGL